MADMTDDAPWVHPDFPTDMGPPMRILCEEFVRNGGYKAAAFLIAYPECGANTKNKKERARRLFKDERMVRYIGVLQALVQEEVVYTLATHLDKLADLRNNAEKVGQFAAAISAEKAIGNAVGHQTPQGSNSIDKSKKAPILNIQRPSSPAKLKVV